MDRPKPSQRNRTVVPATTIAHTNPEPVHHAEPEKIPTTSLDFLNLMPFGGEKLDDDDEPKQVAEHKETPWAPVTDTDFLSVLPYAGLDDAEADEIFGSNKDRKQKLAKTRDQLHKEKKKQKNKHPAVNNPNYNYANQILDEPLEQHHDPTISTHINLDRSPTPIQADTEVEDLFGDHFISSYNEEYMLPKQPFAHPLTSHEEHHPHAALESSPRLSYAFNDKAEGGKVIQIPHPTPEGSHLHNKNNRAGQPPGESSSIEPTTSTLPLSHGMADIEPRPQTSAPEIKNEPAPSSITATSGTEGPTHHPHLALNGSRTRLNTTGFNDDTIGGRVIKIPLSPQEEPIPPNSTSNDNRSEQPAAQSSSIGPTGSTSPPHNPSLPPSEIASGIPMPGGHKPNPLVSSRIPSTSGLDDPVHHPHAEFKGSRPTSTGFTNDMLGGRVIKIPHSPPEGAVPSNSNKKELAPNENGSELQSGSDGSAASTLPTSNGPADIDPSSYIPPHKPSSHKTSAEIALSVSVTTSPQENLAKSHAHKPNPPALSHIHSTSGLNDPIHHPHVALDSSTRLSYDFNNDIQGGRVIEIPYLPSEGTVPSNLPKKDLTSNEDRSEQPLHQSSSEPIANTLSHSDGQVDIEPHPQTPTPKPPKFHDSIPHENLAEPHEHKLNPPAPNHVHSTSGLHDPIHHPHAALDSSHRRPHGLNDDMQGGRVIKIPYSPSNLTANENRSEQPPGQTVPIEPIASTFSPSDGPVDTEPHPHSPTSSHKSPSRKASDISASNSRASLAEAHAHNTSPPAPSRIPLTPGINDLIHHPHLEITGSRPTTTGVNDVKQSSKHVGIPYLPPEETFPTNLPERSLATHEIQIDPPSSTPSTLSYSTDTGGIKHKPHLSLNRSSLLKSYPTENQPEEISLSTSEIPNTPNAHPSPIPTGTENHTNLPHLTLDNPRSPAPGLDSPIGNESIRLENSEENLTRLEPQNSTVEDSSTQISNEAHSQPLRELPDLMALSFTSNNTKRLPHSTADTPPARDALDSALEQPQIQSVPDAINFDAPLNDSSENHIEPHKHGSKSLITQETDTSAIAEAHIQPRTSDPVALTHPHILIPTNIDHHPHSTHSPRAVSNLVAPSAGATQHSHSTEIAGHHTILNKNSSDSQNSFPLDHSQASNSPHSNNSFHLPNPDHSNRPASRRLTDTDSLSEPAPSDDSNRHGSVTTPLIDPQTKRKNDDFRPDHHGLPPPYSRPERELDPMRLGGSGFLNSMSPLREHKIDKKPLPAYLPSKDFVGLREPKREPNPMHSPDLAIAPKPVTLPLAFSWPLTTRQTRMQNKKKNESQNSSAPRPLDASKPQNGVADALAEIPAPFVNSAHSGQTPGKTSIVGEQGENVSRVDPLELKHDSTHPLNRGVRAEGGVDQFSPPPYVETGHTGLSEKPHNLQNSVTEPPNTHPPHVKPSERDGSTHTGPEHHQSGDQARRSTEGPLLEGPSNDNKNRDQTTSIHSKPLHSPQGGGHHEEHESPPALPTDYPPSEPDTSIEERKKVPNAPEPREPTGNVSNLTVEMKKSELTPPEIATPPVPAPVPPLQETAVPAALEPTLEKKSEAVLPVVAEPTLEKKIEPDIKVNESTAKDITPAPPESPPAQAVIASPLPVATPKPEEVKPAETSESTAIEAPQPIPKPQQSVDPPVPKIPIKPTELKSIETIEAEPERPHLLPPEEPPIPPVLAPKVDKKPTENQTSEPSEPSPLQADPTSTQDAATPPSPDVPPINKSDPLTIPANDIPKPEISPTPPPSVPQVQASPVPPPMVAAHKQDIKTSRELESPPPYTPPHHGILDLLKSHTGPTSHKLAQMNIIPHQASVPVYHVQVIQHNEVLPVYTPTPVKIKPPAKTTEASLHEGMTSLTNNVLNRKPSICRPPVTPSRFHIVGDRTVLYHQSELIRKLLLFRERHTHLTRFQRTVLGYSNSYIAFEVFRALLNVKKVTEQSKAMGNWYLNEMHSYRRGAYVIITSYEPDSRRHDILSKYREPMSKAQFEMDFCNLLDLIEYLRQILAPMTWISCGNGQCTATVVERMIENIRLAGDLKNFLSLTGFMEPEWHDFINLKIRQLNMLLWPAVRGYSAYAMIRLKCNPHPKNNCHLYFPEIRIVVYEIQDRIERPDHTRDRKIVFNERLQDYYHLTEILRRYPANILPKDIRIDTVETQTWLHKMLYNT